MAVEAEIVRLRAKWDQVEAMVSELEGMGESFPGARLSLAFAKELLDHAERLDALTEDE